MSFPSYVKYTDSEPANTFCERYAANLRDALSEHPEDELEIKQQILILSQSFKKDDEIIDLAFELLAKDTEGIYANDCYLILARVYTDKKEIAKAIEYYRKTIEVDPSYEEAIMELATLYENQLNYDALDL